MYKFPTVKDVMDKLKLFPEDAKVCFGHFSAFIEEKDGRLVSAHGKITDKEAYDLFCADNVEYGDFYVDARNSNPSGFRKMKCVIISSG